MSTTVETPTPTAVTALLAAFDAMHPRGVSIGLFTRDHKPGWLCQLNAVKQLKFFSAEAPTLEQAFVDAKAKLDAVLPE